MLPAIVEEIIEGNLANVLINRNFIDLTGRIPPKYTIKSFGVPGIKNSKNKVKYKVFWLENSLLLSIFSILSLEAKLYIKSLPNILTAKKTIKLLINAPN